ncbi:MAG: pyrroline-5-carboxylate reductase family protein, partial [Desulfomonilaceae bacterium]
MHTISCIGAGNMGSALVRGLVQSGAFHPDSVKVFDIDRSKTLSLHQDFGVQPLERLEDSVADRATVLVLAVKPQVLGGVLDMLSSALHEGALVISIAAGISTGYILTRVGKSIRLVRAMPNAAATVGRSVTALCRGGTATEQDLELASSLFSAI